MGDKKAIEIIKMLADGIDPNTGEVFPPDSPYQSVDIVRALHTAEEALKKESQKSTIAEKSPRNVRGDHG